MIYYHFGSKQALYRELLRSTFSRSWPSGCARSPPAARAPAEMLDRAIETIAELAREKAFLPSIMLREVAEGGAHLDRATLAELSAVPVGLRGHDRSRRAERRVPSGASHRRLLHDDRRRSSSTWRQRRSGASSRRRACSTWRRFQPTSSSNMSRTPCAVRWWSRRSGGEVDTMKPVDRTPWVVKYSCSPGRRRPRAAARRRLPTGSGSRDRSRRLMCASRRRWRAHSRSAGHRRQPRRSRRGHRPARHRRRDAGARARPCRARPGRRAAPAAACRLAARGYPAGRGPTGRGANRRRAVALAEARGRQPDVDRFESLLASKLGLAQTARRCGGETRRRTRTGPARRGTGSMPRPKRWPGLKAGSRREEIAAAAARVAAADVQIQVLEKAIADATVTRPDRRHRH